MSDSKKSQQFVHLKTHSEYSISDGILRIESLIERAVEFDMPAVAITDHMNLFALVKFYREAIAAGIKPIVGADLKFQEDGETYCVTAFCQNQTGYRNLTQLISKAYLEGQINGIPYVKWSWLESLHEGLIILSGAKWGNVGIAILNGRLDLAEQRLKRWLQLFPNRFYLELQRTQREQEENYLIQALNFVEQFAIPVVATNDVRFLDRDDFEAHETRVCIHSGYVLSDEKRPHLYNEQQYLKSPQEMLQLFADIPAALENTVQIAKRCNLQLSLDKAYLPQFPLPAGIVLEDYFREQAQQGLQRRLAQNVALEQNAVPTYHDRLQLELDVIIRMGFAGYFLIVADFIAWAESQKIPVGPGRGSGAGSLVAYSLGITALDPLVHDLLFERFLNPERVSLPDFDIDFCMERRDEVIEYVAQRYGRDKVSQIITYGTMAARAVMRDVGRVLGMPYGMVDKITKLIPFEIGMTLEKALEQEPNLKERYQNEEEVTTLIDLAKKLEGITRNAGKHAGGVVIAPSRLVDFTPLYCEPDGTHPVTQFDKDDIEAIGLIKFDFLGLRTLTIIDWAVIAINANRTLKNESPIDITKIPLDDKKTFALLQQCATTAVFQLESRGMKDLVRRLKPDQFEEITALVALFRPGPLQSGMVEDFIDRKHGRAAVHYPHPDLEPILRQTYGVILYQEQVMQIAQVLAGYSLGGADILRRAMGKKKPEEMAKQRQVFVQGALKRGINEEVSTHIFDLMEKFAGYGFNKSHSAAYALLSYQTAWLKAHYPAEFMAAVLSSDMQHTDKVVTFITECREMGLEVLPPDIQYGQYHFTVNSEGKIVYGLGAIKGAGEAAVHHMVEEREKNGHFSDLFSFCERVDMHKVTRRIVEPLIRSGAMDSFKVHRASLMMTLEKALQAAEQKLRNKTMGQGDLFGCDLSSNENSDEKNYISCAVWDEQTRLRGEKETLGMYLSGHPLRIYENELTKLSVIKISELALRNKNAVVAGIVMNIRIINTRTGRRMAVIALEDQTGRIEVTLFSDLLETIRKDLAEDELFFVKGKVEEDTFSGGIKIVAEKMERLDQVRRRLAKRIIIHMNSESQVNELLSQLPPIIKPFCGGSCDIAIAYSSNNARAEIILGEAWRVLPDPDLLTRLQIMCGEDRVKVEY